MLASLNDVFRGLIPPHHACNPKICKPTQHKCQRARLGHTRLPGRCNIHYRSYVALLLGRDPRCVLSLIHTRRNYTRGLDGMGSQEGVTGGVDINPPPYGLPHGGG